MADFGLSITAQAGLKQGLQGLKAALRLKSGADLR